MNPFSVWTLATGGIVVSCGWLILLLTVHRMLHRRSYKPPAHHADAPVGWVYTSRAAYGGGLARGPVVAAPRPPQVDAATTSLLPLAPAAAVSGGGLRAGWGGTPLALAGPATVRFDGASVTAPRRAGVAAADSAAAAATTRTQVLVRITDQPTQEWRGRPLRTTGR